MLRSCARALSTDGDVFQILAREIGAEHEFRRARPVAEILRQHRRAGDVEPAAQASSMARLARTRAARNSSVSPARALRRPMRIFWPDGAGVISSPAARASLIIGLVSGLCIQRAPRSNGTSKVDDIGLAAAADLARRLHHDHLAVRRHDPPRRSNAGRARADHDNVGLARQRRAPHAPPPSSRRRRQACGRRQEVAAGHCHVMVSGALKETRTASELCRISRGAATTHGESIMIDPFGA